MTLLAVQRALATVEDRVLPLKLGSERRKPVLALGILYRGVKLIGLDVPQDHMLMVIGHELFGHGARLRELGNGSIKYGFDAPIPYGEGGAVTKFRGEFPVTPLALLALDAAGIEAQNVLADTIAERALSRRRIHYREAWLYFESRLIGMTYIRSASDFSSEGHDVANFLATFKDACMPPACTPIARRDMKRDARLTLADPLFFFAIYGFTAGYVGNGRAVSGIPMIPLGHNLRYLPSLGFHMTPYGTERLVRNWFVRSDGMGAHVATVTLRVGTTGASTPWGLGARASNVLRLGGLPVSLGADLWRQPNLFADQTSAPLEMGAAGSATIVLPMPGALRSNWMSGILVTLGYKSSGFVPGEQLRDGLIFRAGVAIGAEP